MLTAVFDLEKFIIFFLLFSYVEIQLDKKAKANFENYDVIG